MTYERQLAHKVWIADLFAGVYVASTGEFEPNYLAIDDVKIARVNVIGTVVEKFVGELGSYVTVTLDDGTWSIQLRAFKDDVRLLESVSIGDVVLAIAKPRTYQEELYLLPEIVKKIANPNWELLRKVELLNVRGRPKQAQRAAAEVVQGEQIQVVAEKRDQGLRNKALEIIAQHSEFGISMDVLAERLDKNLVDAEGIVDGLVREGLVYQDRPGWYKIV